jgi:uncharacterized protein YdcH (DUF465 family)
MDLTSSERTGCQPADLPGQATDLPGNRPSQTTTHQPGLLPGASEAIAVKSEQGTQSVNHQQEIVPMDLHHPILREFPEHRETIRRLKGANDHFRNIFDEYHRLDDEIYRIEEEIDFATDQETEALKMRRAKLKDYIYRVIRQTPAACPVFESAAVAR